MATTASFQGKPPYLTVWDVISLGWLYYPILSLLFVAFSLWIAARSASDGVEDAKRSLLTSCGAAEKAATVAASLPRWMAQSTNEELNEAIRQSIEASHSALEAVLTVVEAIIDFVIDIFKGLQLCLFQFAIRGALAVLIQFTVTTKQFLDTILDGIADGIQASMSAATSAVNSAIDGVNSVINQFNSINPFGNIDTMSHISIGFDVDAIREFTIPDSISDQLTQLNSSIPTLDQLREELQTLVAVPFNAIKGEMNETFAAVGTPNVTVPIPAVQEIEFCNDLDTSFIDELGDDLVRIAYIGIGILVAIAVVIFLVNGFLTWLRFKLMDRHVDDVRDRWAAGDVSGSQGSKRGGTTQLTPRALLTLDNELSHSFAYKVLDVVDRIPFLHLSPIAHDRLAWFLSYIFSPSALVCLLIGLFGIISICIQLIAVKPIQRKVTQEVARVTQVVIDSVGSKINAAVADDSTTFANAVNSQLSEIDAALNDQLFAWIGDATEVLNNTIVAYYDDLETSVTDAFAGTLFSDPTVEFLRCVIGDKIGALEGAIEFLQTRLRIPIPRVDEDVFLLSDLTLAQVSSPVADAAVGGGDGGIFGRLVDRYLEVLRSELITFGIILGVWGFIVCMGLVILLWDIFGRERWHAYQTRKQAPSAEFMQKDLGDT